LNPLRTGNQEVLVTISSVDFMFEIGKSWEKAGEVVKGRGQLLQVEVELALD
jgi:hypothetical protein